MPPPPETASAPRSSVDIGIRRTERTAVLVIAALVLAAYSATLSVAHELGFLDALRVGAANALPTLIFGAAAFWLVTRLVVGRRPAIQAISHLAIGAAFAILTYWMLLVMLGLMNGSSATQFEVRPLISRAMAWQLLQNVTTYAIVALLAHYRAHRRAPVAAAAEGAPAQDPLSRYFIRSRSGEEILPVDVEAIISITGAGDYTEVATPTGRHLVRMSLGKFEQVLDPARFIRVHRSRIVNLHRVTRAEPAGDGRLLIHLGNGEEVVTSRAGATALRERIL